MVIFNDLNIIWVICTCHVYSNSEEDMKFTKVLMGKQKLEENFQV
jgi:hypothetical protein